MLRILFLGENWAGSNARSCAEALKRLGNDVFVIDLQTFLPRLKSLTSRIAIRILRENLVREYNRYIMEAAKLFRPDILFAFKGNYVYPKTLSELRNIGACLYNYYPDTSAFTHGPWIPRSLPQYDCIFYTKRFWYADVTKSLKLRGAMYIPHGFDPHLHRIVELDSRDIRDYQCDVSLIATHTPYKEEILRGLLRLRPEIDLCVWGEGWSKRNRTASLNRCIKGIPLIGDCYVRAIQATRINLAIMSGRVRGASSGDLTTNRSYNIPACGGFMMHERNQEVSELYEEGKEIECFETAEELANKIDYYVQNVDERSRIAHAGYTRCTPAYSYDARMQQILAWHDENNPKNRNGKDTKPRVASVPG